jgi:hypothetical protein
MDKLLKGAGGTLSLLTYDSTGALGDVNGTNAPDLVTVVDSSGTTVTTPTGVRNSTGNYSAPIPVTYTTLDTFGVTWHWANNVSRTSGFEVVGGVLFSVAEFRAFDPALASGTTYPYQRVVDIRETVEERFSSCAGVSFTRRGQRDYLDGNGMSSILASWPRIARVVSVKIDGIAQTASDFKGYDTGRLEHTAGVFSSGFQNIEVLYEHGYDPPPFPIVEAAKRYGRELIVKGAFDDMSSATSIQTELGLMRISQPSEGKVGIPEVDAVLADYGHSALVG